MILEKRPRHYKDDIMKLATKEERAHYLKTVVPEHLRELTRTHYKIAVETAKWQKHLKLKARST